MTDDRDYVGLSTFGDMAEAQKLYKKLGLKPHGEPWTQVGIAVLDLILDLRVHDWA